MRIGIDISSLVYGTGVSRYTSNLVKSLIKFSSHNLSLFGGSLRQLSKLKKISSQIAGSHQPRLEQKIYPFPPKLQSLLFNQLHLPINYFCPNLDIFHSWDWYTPKCNQSKLVTTIHDLSTLKYPQETHPEIVKNHQQSLDIIKNEATAVIAVSNSTKKDIVELLNIDDKKIHVVHEALPDEQKIKINQQQINQVKKKYSITKPYLLTVASREPRKNLNRTIKAWQKHKSNYQLVLVGQPGFDQINAENDLIITGYVQGSDLAALYSGSSCLIYASTHEGFGLPILEAFHHQIPVVASNTSCMPEISGNAAILVNPLDVDSISHGISQAIDQKNTLIKKGIARLRHFSWKNVAKQTLKVYRKAVS